MDLEKLSYKEIIELYIKRAESIYKKKIPSPFIKYFSGISTLGYYMFSKNSIFINIKYSDLNENLYKKYIFTHELAHHITKHLYKHQYKIKPHGKEFKSICDIVFPEITKEIRKSTTSMFNKYEVKSNRKKTKWEYKCNCMKHEVSTYVHNKIQSGYNYTCKKCKTSLKYNNNCISK